MSKLSKRAITLFVIATMVLSMLSAFIAVPVMADDISVTVTYGPWTVGEYIPASTEVSTFDPITAITAASTITLTFPAGTILAGILADDFTIIQAGGVGVATVPSTIASDALARTITLTVDDLSLHTDGLGVVTIATSGAAEGDEIKHPTTATTTATFVVDTSVGDAGTKIDVTFDPDIADTLTVEGIPDPFEAGTTSGVTVTALDKYGNIATGYTETITFSSTDDGTGILLPASNTLPSGVRVFDGVTSGQIVKLVTVGEQSVTAIDGGITGSQTEITVYVAGTSDFSIDHVSSDVVIYDDVLTVYGSGVTSGSAVNVYWDFVTAASQLNVTTGKPSGDFECEVSVPSAYFGDHYIWAKDLSTGLSTSWGPIHVGPSISVSPSSELAGEPVEVSAYGFEAEEYVEIVIDDTSVDPVTLVAFTAEKETNDDGHIVLEVTLPSAWDDGDYTIECTDNTGKYAEADVTIGPALKLDVSVGPTGTVVKADGRGFNPLATITAETGIKLEAGGYDVDTKDGGDITVSSGGTFSVYIVIPSAPEGEYYVTFTDSGIAEDPPAPAVPSKEASAEFEVDGETSITVTPTYGTPGASLIVKGYNFTQISGTVVDLALESQAVEAKTDASGSFTATIVIPPLDFGVTYTVHADDTKNCFATDDVLVALMVLQLSEYSAPVGTEVTLMGSGLKAGGDWNATFGDMDLLKDKQTSSTTTTYFSEYFYVPSVPSGTYTIGVYDIDRDITVNIDFTVTEQAALSVSRSSIPNGYNLTIEGVNFVELADKATEWWIYNSTDAWNIDENVTQGLTVKVNPPITDKDGEVTAWYMIPDFLELGSYTINCTTVSNPATDPEVTQYAELDIEIVPEETVLNIGAPSYARGQTITFVIKTTLKKDPFYLGIKDPEGSEVFNSTWDVDAWKSLGAWFYIPSNFQIDKSTGDVYSLPVDAMPGTWTYSIWDKDKEYKNGTFQVTQLTEIEQLQQDIGGIATSVLDLGTSVIDLATTVAGVSGAAAEAATAAATAAAAAAEAQAAAEAGIAAIDDMSEISQDALDAANNAVSAADLAKDAADAGLAAALAAQVTSQAAVDAAQTAAEAAEANQRTTSGLTSLVYGAIGASLIAALAAIVSLMQISRRIAG